MDRDGTATKYQDLDANTASESFTYDPETGIIRWKVRPSNRTKIGSVAGVSKNCHGYLRIGLGGKVYGAHRVAWLLHHGTPADGYVDHINGDRADNRAINLRLATHAQNLRNRGPQKNNTSGAKGVCWHKGAGKWVAHIAAGGKMKYLGCFSDIEDAKSAYAKAADELHKEFARL